MLLDLRTNFPGGRSSGLVFPSPEEFSIVCCDPHSQKLWHSQLSRTRCFSGILLLFLWSSGYWQFDLWFLCLFCWVRHLVQDILQNVYVCMYVCMCVCILFIPRHHQFKMCYTFCKFLDQINSTLIFNILYQFTIVFTYSYNT